MPRFAFAAYDNGRAFSTTCVPGGSSAGRLSATFATRTSSSTWGASFGRSSPSSEACPCETTTAETRLTRTRPFPWSSWCVGACVHMCNCTETATEASRIEHLAVDLDREPRRLRPGEKPRPFEACLDEPWPFGQGSADRRGEVATLGVEDRVPAHLANGSVPARDDRHAARHRLRDRQPKALVARRKEQAGGAPVEPCELVLLDEAAHVDAAPAKLRGERHVALRTDRDERQAELLRRYGRGERILPPLDRADEQEVVVVRAVGLRAEDRVVRKRGHDDLLGFEPVELDEIVLRSLRDRQHPRRPPRRPRHDGSEDRCLPPAHQGRVTLEGEVLHGQHRRRGNVQRQRMHEMRKRRTQAA